MIAQLGERQTEDLEVLGSIPSPGSFFSLQIWSSTKQHEKFLVGTEHSSVGRAFDCRISGYRMVPGSIPGVRKFLKLLALHAHRLVEFFRLHDVRVSAVV